MSARAIIYIRVSEGRQVDNTSLESQEDACRRWSAQNGLEVEHVFVEKGESAKTADRTQFQAMSGICPQFRKAASATS